VNPSSVAITYYDGPNDTFVDLGSHDAPDDKAPLIAETLVALLPSLVPALLDALNGGRDVKAEIEAAKDSAEAAAILHEVLKFHVRT
jgi:hypothetical protein